MLGILGVDLRLADRNYLTNDWPTLTNGLTINRVITK